MDFVRGLVKDGQSFVGFCADRCKTHGIVEIHRFTYDVSLTMVIYAVTVSNVSNVSNVSVLIKEWNKLWTCGFDKTYTIKTIPFTIVFSLELDNKIIGVCGYNKYDEVIHLHSLAIAKEYLKKGYARKFCENILAFSKTKGKYLIAGVTMNTQTWLPDFYKSLGFEFVDDMDPRFAACLEYKFPRLFSSCPLIWMLLT